MTNDTVKETWIDKLVDELVVAKNDISELSIEHDQLNNLVRILFNNARLDYNGEGLTLTNDTAVYEYLRALNPTCYNARLDKLKADREAEELEKSKAAKGKKEA